MALTTHKIFVGSSISREDRVAGTHQSDFFVTLLGETQMNFPARHWFRSNYVRAADIAILIREPVVFQKTGYPTLACRRNIEMTPLCKIEVTHPRVLGSREVRRGGVVDEQAGVQPS